MNSTISATAQSSLDICDGLNIGFMLLDIRSQFHLSFDAVHDSHISLD